MTRNRSSWLAKGRRLASSAYHRTVGEVVQRRRSRAYMAAGGRVAAPAPTVPERTADGHAAAARTRVPQAARPPRTHRTRGRSR